MKKIIALCICFMWMTVIFYNSSVNGVISEQKSYYLLNFINAINTDSLQIFRKTAHVIEYLILAIAISTVLSYYKFTVVNSVIFVMFLCLFCSAADEFYQAFIPGRTARVSDVLIDFCGCIIGLIILFTISSIRKICIGKPESHKT